MFGPPESYNSSSVFSERLERQSSDNQVNGPKLSQPWRIKNLVVNAFDEPISLSSERPSSNSSISHRYNRSAEMKAPALQEEAMVVTNFDFVTEEVELLKKP